MCWRVAFLASRGEYERLGLHKLMPAPTFCASFPSLNASCTGLRRETNSAQGQGVQADVRAMHRGRIDIQMRWNPHPSRLYTEKSRTAVELSGTHCIY